MTDEIIGNYRVIKQIGAGGMAKVYLAVHREIANLKVILKILSDPRLVERFKQEADKLALLDGHPNICRIKHFFTHGDDVVIAMEYIHGVTLEEKLEAEGEINIADALTIVAEVLDILQFAHERGIYHRDIKPGNIMIDDSGAVKIIDFGIAKAKSDPNLTIAGTACGTPAYMAPEQFTPSDDMDYARADIYAAGATLFKILTRQLPHKGDNEFALRDAKLFQEPIKPRTLRPGISKELEGCILRSLAKNPEDRYKTAAEMRECILKIAGKGKAKRTEETQDLAAPKESHSRAGGSWVKIAGFVATAVVVIAAVVYFMTGKDDADTGAPTVVSVITPDDGTVFTDDATPALKWTVDPASGVSYIVEYATDPAFADSRTLAGGNTGAFEFPAALESGRYYYRLYAMGTNGLRSDPSPVRSFVIDVASVETVRGTVAIRIEPRGDVYLDATRVASRVASFDTLLEPGAYAVRVANNASVEGEYSESLLVAADQVISRSFRFTFAAPPEPEPGPGEVRVGSRPRGATVYIDGVLQSQETNYTFSLPPGRHIIRATLDMGTEVLVREDTIRVVADSTHKVLFEFE